MTTKRDYYEILGLPREASAEDVKKAYRRLALEYHPDRNKTSGAADRFKEVNEAYQTLNDPERRAAYDRFGHAGVTNGGGAGFTGHENFGGFGDIFDAFFGGSPAGTRHRRRVVAGADLRYDLTIEFAEAVSGVTREISFPTLVRCAACEGSGAEPGSQPEKCPECNGTGEKRRVSQTILGQMVNITACPRCGGEGRVISEPCKTCRGEGRIREQRTLMVEVPAGIDSGQRIAIEGQGESGPRGGPPGDLYVAVTVREHALLLRRGTELYFELPVTFPQATLGAQLPIPTVEGIEPVEIPAGTQSGTEIRLRGRGVPRLRGAGRGDLHVIVTVVVPHKPSRQERDLLKQLGEVSGPAVLPKGGPTLVDRLRDLFS